MLTNNKGEYSNAVYGFVNILTKAIQEQKPEYIAIAFDFGRKTFRNDIYKEYKATRKGMPNELATQMPLLKQVLSAMNIKYFEKENIEADDIIGTLSKEKGVQKLLLSGDRDLFQLIDNETFAWFPKKGISDIELIDKETLNKLMGLTPSQVVDYKSLRGDTSDNIPGVAGIGEKGAMDLIQQYASLQGVYENIENIKGKLKEKLINGKDMAFISYQLATIERNVDIDFKLEDWKYSFPYNKKTFDIFKQYQFNSLIRRKDIFDKNVSDLSEEEVKTFLTVKVASQQELEKVIGFIKEEKRIAFDLSSNKLSFSCSPNAIYTFEEEISLFSSDFSIERAISSLKEIFEDDKIYKVCLDLKKHKHLLQGFNVDIKGETFDITLARYLLGEELKNNDECPSYFYLEKELVLKMKDLGVYDLYQNIELPLVNVLFAMENNGMLIDTKELDTLAKDLREELDSISEKVQGLAGERFNLNSPKQLSNILFEKLGLKAFNNKKIINKRWYFNGNRKSARNNPLYFKTS